MIGPRYIHFNIAHFPLQALKDAHLKVDQLNARIKELTIENQAFQAQVSGSKMCRKRLLATPALAERVDKISLLGKKFAIMNSPFLHGANFLNLTGQPEVHVTGSARFQSAKSIEQGFVAELYDAVPLYLHPLMEKEPAFAETVGDLNF